MSYRIETPAPYAAMAQARSDKGGVLIAGRRLRGRILSQFVHSVFTAAVFDGDDLVLLVGVYPYPEFNEMWFVAGPRCGARPFQSVRVFKALMASIIASYENVVSFVRTDEAAAMRLAHIGGGVPSGETGQVGHIPFEVFRWVDC